MAIGLDRDEDAAGTRRLDRDWAAPGRLRQAGPDRLDGGEGFRHRQHGSAGRVQPRGVGRALPPFRRRDIEGAIGRMLTALLVLVIVLVLAAAPFFLLTPKPPRPGGTIQSIDEMEAYLGALVANETPPALDVTVMKGGALVYAKAFGKLDPSGTPASGDAVYHFWSVTKLFTAAAILELADDGKLSLDDPVTSFLPNFRTEFAGRQATVTIRQLLDHTSGMKNLGPLDLVGWIHHLADPPVDQVALVRDRMAGYRGLATAPGKTGAYSNAGYIVLGAIVAAASGESYEDFVRTRLLSPLGMASTDFVYRDDLLARAVAGSHPLFHFFTPLLLMMHTDWFSSWVGKTTRRRMWLRPLYTDYTGPTGLLGTGRDLARFGQAFLNGGELDGKRILRPE